MQISVVIPLFNEADSLPELMAWIHRVMQSNNFSYEVIMIDDGSDYSITWPSVTWKTDSAAAPTLNTSGYTVVVLWKVSSTLYGARVGDA